MTHRGVDIPLNKQNLRGKMINIFFDVFECNTFTRLRRGVHFNAFFGIVADRT